MEQEVSSSRQEVATMSAIEVSLLQKSYEHVQAVNGTSFNVRHGEVFSLLGPNGAGKTTTIEVLEGLRERDSGDVKVLGVDPWKHGYDLHKKLGIIPQGFTFFPKIKPPEALKYYADLFGKTVDANKILETVILEDSARKTVFEDLSGGQKQKVGLALALVNDPELLFLDEPTTGLDPQARRAVWDVIRALKNEGRTIMLTTHYLEEAQLLADRVAIMNHGKIVAMGTPNEIIAEHGSGDTLEVKGNRKLADYLKGRSELDVDYLDADRIRIKIRNNHDIVTAVEDLDKSGLEWSDLRTRRDSLEDIFIKLVGHIGEEGGITTEKSNESRNASESHG